MPKRQTRPELPDPATRRQPSRHGRAERLRVPAQIMALVFGLATALFGAPAAAAADASLICDRAAAEAAAATGVPISVLKAISLTETGRDRGGQTRPWPWTVNMEGKGLWFDDLDAALGYAYEHFKRGARSFDVGCFQINYKWHHEHFASIEEMFDPSANARYAANFLLSLYNESGDWELAAGAFHSRTPEYADRYKARFAEFRVQFAAEDGLPLQLGAPILPVASTPSVFGATARIRVNSYPLLQAGGQTALGSLVPLGSGTGGGASLFARPDAG